MIICYGIACSGCTTRRNLKKPQKIQTQQVETPLFPCKKNEIRHDATRPDAARHDVARPSTMLPDVYDGARRVRSFPTRTALLDV